MRLRSKTDLVALGVLAYLPFLASSPGRVSADSKQDLYLDPGGFLSRVTHLWDPQVGAGTVPHQSLGYLFPTGPWFWVMDRLGAPDWVAQRLWLGTLSLGAALGARWLFQQLGTGRAGAMAGALVYLLTPYQLAFTARMSVLLLPWAALPWLVGWTMRAARTDRWRAPAALGLVLVLAGGINASSLVLVAIGPVLWLILEALRDRQRAIRAARAAARIGLVGIGVSAWWAVGLRVQGTHGLPVLQLTESARTVADLSTPSDLLRGMGNWFFYGRDRNGYSLDQAADYGGANDIVVALSYAVPLTAIAAAFVLRWAYSAYFVLLVVVGTVIGVGAWPYDDPTPFGSLWKTFTSETSVGLALRNTPRIAPLVVLGFAGILAGVVGALPTPPWRRLGAGAVALLAFGGLLPVWQHGFLTNGMQRPEDIPTYWQDAAQAMDADGPGTRVLEIPGSSFAAYRWGTTVDPITPALIDRPYLAREVLPSGGAGTANLLDALDRRMQLGIFEAASLAPVARLLAAGTVVLRGDLERAGRFDAPEAAPLWRALEAAPGLGASRPFGPTGLDASEPSLPAVALFDVRRTRSILRTAPAVRPVVLAGDGDGIVDAAAVGLLDGRSLVLQSAGLDDAVLDRTLRAGAHLVVTDSNRRRAQTWFYTLRDSRGETERAGRTAPDPTGYDFRFEPFPGAGDRSRTVVEQVGATIDATQAGGPERPEHRAANAVDGDLTTAWRVGGADPRGSQLTITPDAPVVARELRLVQPVPPAGGRAVARVRVEVSGAPPMEVDLDATSYSPDGQSVLVPVSLPQVTAVRITLLETSPPAPGHRDAAPVGLTEVRIADLTVDEVVRPPVDLLDRAGPALAGLGLDVVFTRLRVGRAVTDRADDETHLDRSLDLPVPRTFAISGVARPIDEDGVPPAGACRTDLLAVDGAPVAVQLSPGAGGWRVEGCEPLALASGPHRITAVPGVVTGVDLDRVVLSTDATGAPSSIAARGAPADDTGATAEVLEHAPSERRIRIVTDGEPFWLVLAESASSGWTPEMRGASVGARQLVDGYANGWLITPERPGTLLVTLSWGPQRLLSVGLAISAVALVACAAVLWRGRRRGTAARAALRGAPSLCPDVRGGSPSLVRAAILGAAVAAAAALVAPPPLALLAGGMALVGAVMPYGVLLLASAAPMALVLAKLGDRPSLAWVTVALLATLVVRGREPATALLSAPSQPPPSG